MLLLLASGILSLVLNSIVSQASEVAGEGGSSDWIEGCAILASVLIVVGVSATTNYQKETKFRQLNSLKDDILVRACMHGVVVYLGICMQRLLLQLPMHPGMKMTKRKRKRQHWIFGTLLRCMHAGITR